MKPGYLYVWGVDDANKRGGYACIISVEVDGGRAFLRVAAQDRLEHGKLEVWTASMSEVERYIGSGYWRWLA